MFPDSFWEDIPCFVKVILGLLIILVAALGATGDLSKILDSSIAQDAFDQLGIKYGGNEVIKDFWIKDGEIDFQHAQISFKYEYEGHDDANVTAGVWLIDESGNRFGGYNTATLPTLNNSGTATVELIVNTDRQIDSKEIEIFLFERGKPGEPFAEKRFEFKHSWMP